jgi:2-polyprenyl-3-methyl-5-hydroxy-6-metoxy-1,4-benzoquinol methylase
MQVYLGSRAAPSVTDLTAKIEPFESFWEGPADVEKGYSTFGQFYRINYLKHLPANRDIKVLVVSCGPGYFVNLLNEEGYHNVLGMDCDPAKVAYAQARDLNCRAGHAVAHLAETDETYDLIFCEQELNHLTKDEIIMFLDLCWQRLSEGGVIIAHALNGANPITGAEALAQNFDHYNTFTEYTFDQVLGYVGFRNIRVLPLDLYVFYKNPLNYVAMFIAGAFTLFFRIMFTMYGKKNRTFTKKIAAVGSKVTHGDRFVHQH